MDRCMLETRLADRFLGSEQAVAAVARAANDLAASGQYEGDVGAPLDVDAVVDHLADAPAGTVADRWNWWMGSLDAAFGGYRGFALDVDGDRE